MPTPTLTEIADAFDALAAVSTDALADFCSGTVPSDCDEAAAVILGELEYLKGRHPGVSEDSPEVLVRTADGRLLVVGYDDYKGGRGLSVPYEPPVE